MPGACVSKSFSLSFATWIYSNCDQIAPSMWEKTKPILSSFHGRFLIVFIESNCAMFKKQLTR